MASREMSSARSRLRITRSLSDSAQGANVNPQFPMTAEVTPCHAELVPSGSQNTWASIWVCTSMNSGDTNIPSASTSSAPRSSIRPMEAMRPSVTPTSAR